MKYIRTKTKIIEIRNEWDYTSDGGLTIYEKDKNLYFLYGDIVATGDTIEELMMIGDLVFKKNGDIFVIANQAYIDYYIKHKSVSKLFIKDSKGNYIRVAEENEKGELCLL